VTKLPRSDETLSAPRAECELVSGEALWKALGYRTAASFRQAAHRQTVPIHVFDLPHRRGKHAFRRDLDRWLTELVAKEGTDDATPAGKEGSA
jgi:hypothetical protein